MVIGPTSWGGTRAGAPVARVIPVHQREGPPMLTILLIIIIILLLAGGGWGFGRRRRI